MQSNIKKFRKTDLYKQIKYMCNLPPTSKRPNDNWSLVYALMRTEPYGSFTLNQKRCIANRFIPNTKIDCLMKLPHKISACKFNKDGSKLVIGSCDSIFRIYEAINDTYKLRRLDTHEHYWKIGDIDISPCGRYYTYATWMKHFSIVSLNTGETQTVQFRRNDNHIYSVRFSPCGNVIAGCCTKGKFYLYNREIGQINQLYMPLTHDNFALCYLSDNDSNLILTGDFGGLVKLWDLRCAQTNTINVQQKPMSVFVGHIRTILYIDARNDSRYFITSSDDECIKLWDIRQPLSNRLAEKYQRVRLPHYRILQKDSSVMTYQGHPVSDHSLRGKFSPKEQTGQRYIYTGCDGGKIIIYDVLTGQIKEIIEGHQDAVTDTVWHPIRSEIVSVSWDGQVNLNRYQRTTIENMPQQSQLDDSSDGSSDITSNDTSEEDNLMPSSIYA